MTLPVIEAPLAEPSLDINPELTAHWLEAFLHHEMLVRRSLGKAIIGLSAGIDRPRHHVRQSRSHSDRLVP